MCRGKATRYTRPKVAARHPLHLCGVAWIHEVLRSFGFQLSQPKSRNFRAKTHGFAKIMSHQGILFGSEPTFGGSFEASLRLWHKETKELVAGEIGEALQQHDWVQLGRFAGLFSRLRWGTTALIVSHTATFTKYSQRGLHLLLHSNEEVCLGSALLLCTASIVFCTWGSPSFPRSGLRSLVSGFLVC